MNALLYIYCSIALAFFTCAIAAVVAGYGDFEDQCRRSRDTRWYVSHPSPAVTALRVVGMAVVCAVVWPVSLYQVLKP